MYRLKKGVAKAETPAENKHNQLIINNKTAKRLRNQRFVTCWKHNFKKNCTENGRNTSIEKNDYLQYNERELVTQNMYLQFK